ncbi:MAG: SDR family oxidoreductase [Chitinispirillia bacterium]|nr:SDR family oxidoreductase [Chitinispirillia bacterium]
MKYALVTGSTKGIGLAVSAELIEKGYFVYMNYAHDDAAAKAVTFTSGKYRIVKADLSASEGAEILSKYILNDGIKLDCIVLNAGTTCRKPFGQIEYDDWNAVMNVNVNSSFIICQKLYPVMEDFGSVVIIGSDMGIYPHAVSCAYSVSKAASHKLAQSLVKHFAGRGIRINAIAPGFIDTEWQKEKPDWLREKIENKIALKRFGTSKEVADACMFVIENSYVNGTVLQIDGGYDYE